jgi:uracil phosphoribosyltransferase
MNLYNFSSYNTIYNNFLSQLRNIDIQNDRMRFRRNLERLGEISAYEISKELEFSNKNISTPLGVSNMSVISEKPVVATILRAGLPLHQGLLYRKHSSDDDFEVEIEYLASPNLEGREVILNDPMLASGKSMVLAYKALLKKGIPKKIHVVCVIASEEGVEFVKNNMPKNTSIWAGAIDKEMSSESFIVPGLGDAGDLAFGSKQDN